MIICDLFVIIDYDAQQVTMTRESRAGGLFAMAIGTATLCTHTIVKSFTQLAEETCQQRSMTLKACPSENAGG